MPILRESDFTQGVRVVARWGWLSLVSFVIQTNAPHSADFGGFQPSATLIVHDHRPYTRDGQLGMKVRPVKAACGQ